jgi:hypothetical protein
MEYLENNIYINYDRLTIYCKTRFYCNTCEKCNKIMLLQRVLQHLIAELVFIAKPVVTQIIKNFYYLRYIYIVVLSVSFIKRCKKETNS